MKWQLALSVSLVTLVSANAQGLAQTPTPADAQAGEKIDRLQKEVEERDALIRDLAARIARLEGRQAKNSPSRPPTTIPAGQSPSKEPPPRVAQQSPPSPQSTEFGNGKPTSPETRAPQVAQQTLPSSQPSTGPSGPTTVQPAQPTPPTAAGVGPAQPAQQSPQSTQQQPPEVGDEAGTFTVSADAAQHALERALVQSGAGLLTPWTVEVVPGVLYQYNQISLPGQIALSTTGNVLVTGQVLRSTTLQGSTLVRLGLPWDSQMEVSGNYDYKSVANTTRVLTTGISQTVTSATGFGDPTLTLTKQVLSESEWLPNLFVSGTWNADLGQFKRGIPLGMGFDQFRIGVIATKRQDPLVFTAGFSYQKSLENKGVVPGDQFTPSVGLLFAVSPETTLQLSQQLAFANAVKRNGQIISGSDQVSGIFNIGLLTILRPGLVVNLTAGIGETADAPNFTVQLSIPIRLN
jgi:hypothetical protein